MIVTRPIHLREPDLLRGSEHRALCFVANGSPPRLIAHVPAPIQGWSHQTLEAVAPPEGCWDAYLGNQWVGSSEV